MSKELQSLNERIAERVGKELVDLIPPDQWQALVNAQITRFKREAAPQIINNILTEELKKQVSARLKSAEYVDGWDSFANEATNEAVKEMIKTAAPEILSAMLAPVMSGFMQDLRNRFYS